MPRFTAPSPTQQTGQSSATQKTKVKPQFVTSKSAQPSKAASSSQTVPAKQTNALKSKPPLPPGTMFIGFDKPEVDSNAGPSDNSEAFQKDWTSTLHKPAEQFKTGPPINAARSEVSTQASSHALVVDAAARPNIIRGPDPNLSPLREDDKKEQVREDLVTGDAAIFDDDGHVDNFPSPDDNAPSLAQHEQMDIDGDEPQSSDEATSPLPTNAARRLSQGPRISFVFDDTTGDLVEPHPAIFLSRPTAPPSQSPDLRRSPRSHTSPVNPDVAYLKLAQGSNPDAKRKKKKDAKSKDKASDPAVPRKRARNDDDTAQVKDKPAPKKPKLKETIVIDEDERSSVNVAPGLPNRRQLLWASVVEALAKVVRNGIKKIGVLIVNKDFGDFVEVDNSYWSKAVAPFVGERYTTACDHCKRLGTQCRKLVTHTVKCVNGVAALNPIGHYRPKGS
ncbi:hypothetical protein ARMGADRAFT_1112034, partial [Armillaria gallica]